MNLRRWAIRDKCAVYEKIQWRRKYKKFLTLGIETRTAQTIATLTREDSRCHLHQRSTSITFRSKQIALLFDKICFIIHRSHPWDSLHSTYSIDWQVFYKCIIHRYKQNSPSSFRPILSVIIALFDEKSSKERLKTQWTMCRSCRRW